MLSYFMPVKTVSETNMWEHWSVRRKRAKEQRTLAKSVSESAAREAGFSPTPPMVVRLTRVGRRRLDSDNLQGSLKHIRDGIADWLQIDDSRDDLVRWDYAQTVSAHVGVNVVIELDGGLECLGGS